MNLFLVTSPLQLLCAIEAKHHFGTSSNILIIREEKSQSAVRQMRVLLDKSEWDHVIFIGRKSKIWEARKLHSKLKSIHNSLSFLYIFYADYSAWRTNVLLNNIDVKHEVMFDDGVGTVREFHEKIQPQLVVSRNKPSRDFLLKLMGLKPARKIYPRNNFSFFTFFSLPESKFKVTINTLSTLQGRLGTAECFSKTAPIGFIGQGMVAEKGIKLEYYENMLRTLIQDNGTNMVYFPHRTEKEFVKERLKQVEGLSYHESSMPLELEIAEEKIMLSKIYGITSTASISLEKLYPSIPVINLNIPIQHYMVEAFGINFHNVAKQLNLRSLDLE